MSSASPSTSPEAFPAAPPSSSIQCGTEAVSLLNCLAAGGTCEENIQAFQACAKKSKLKEFLLLEECPASKPPTAAAKPPSK
mmetsp:Transcript_46441/g.110651  ORF Transcript_46441/g.110651 Transcript_46441/m.110651 type:complete len:82 (-) Transcript_46441:1210-1455(-)